MRHVFIKRIHKEVEEAIKEEVIPIHKIETTHIPEEPDSKNMITTVEINNNIKILLEKNYPFGKPKVLINDRAYFFYLKTPSDRVTKLLKKTGIDCLCCSTILCDWIITYQINNILREIKKFNKIKRDIKYNIVVQEILNKYPNIPDHLILDYLLD
jgi:predicted nucleotide-binding protein (sugar kinase/HSP70/actin superfamily)